jgi:carboxymethylenebutenolidase
MDSPARDRGSNRAGNGPGTNDRPGATSPLARRRFLDAAGKFAVGGMTGAMLLDLLDPRFAQAQKIKPNDKRLEARYQEFDSPQGSGKLKGYLARPAAGKRKLPAVLVVHENRGLTPHIEDVTRRMALEGFLAFAPDSLTALGGYPGDEEKARKLMAKVGHPKLNEDFLAAAGYLKEHPESTGKVGVVGFCYGAMIAHLIAVRVPDLASAVLWDPHLTGFLQHAAPPSALASSDVAKIKSPLLIHHAEKTEGAAAYEAELKAARVKYEMYMYPGVEHGFNNDSTPIHDKAAAALAWKRTVAFFKKNLC